MTLRPLSRNLLKNAPVFLTKIHPIAPTLIQKHQRICTRHFSSVKESQVVSSDDYNGSGSYVKLQKTNAMEKRFMNEQAELFADPTYFQTPVLMLHCSWTDFAVSFHAPDK